jgi:transcriptional regulator with XRE-family HTH domain
MTGDTLKAWRQAQGWTQTQMARYLGTTQVNIARWERGTHGIPRTIDILLHLLGQKRNVTAVENFLFKSLDT